MCLRKPVFAGALLVVALASCTPAQQAAAPGYQQDIAAACNVAMMLAPMAGPVAPWIVAGCATEEAVARLALDPSSLAWVNGLVAQARG